MKILILLADWRNCSRHCYLCRRSVVCSRAGQTGLSVANGLPLLRCSFGAELPWHYAAEMIPPLITRFGSSASVMKILSDNRRYMIEKIAVHIADFSPRLTSNIRALYQYVPIPAISYPQLEDELFCNIYYLRHLCDETRFPDWPIKKPVSAGNVCSYVESVCAPITLV